MCYMDIFYAEFSCFQHKSLKPVCTVCFSNVHMQRQKCLTIMYCIRELYQLYQPQSLLLYQPHVCLSCED